MEVMLPNTVNVLSATGVFTLMLLTLRHVNFFSFLLSLAAPGLTCSTWDLQSLSWHVGSCFLTRNQTQAPRTGSVES